MTIKNNVKFITGKNKILINEEAKYYWNQIRTKKFKKFIINFNYKNQDYSLLKLNIIKVQKIIQNSSFLYKKRAIWIKNISFFFEKKTNVFSKKLSSIKQYTKTIKIIRSLIDILRFSHPKYTKVIITFFPYNKELNKELLIKKYFSFKFISSNFISKIEEINFLLKINCSKYNLNFGKKFKEFLLKNFVQYNFSNQDIKRTLIILKIKFNKVNKLKKIDKYFLNIGKNSYFLSEDYFFFKIINYLYYIKIKDCKNILFLKFNKLKNTYYKYFSFLDIRRIFENIKNYNELLIQIKLFLKKNKIYDNSFFKNFEFKKFLEEFEKFLKIKGSFLIFCKKDVDTKKIIIQLCFFKLKIFNINLESLIENQLLINQTYLTILFENNKNLKKGFEFVTYLFKNILS
jgi:hypothetical protein